MALQCLCIIPASHPRSLPGLNAAIHAQLASMVNRTAARLTSSLNGQGEDDGDGNTTSNSSSSGRLAGLVSGAQQRAAVLLNGTLDALFGTLNSTSGFMGRALEVQDDVSAVG